MDDFLGGDGSDDSEVLVQRAQLRGVAPFPSWNGTIDAASSAASGHCSVLCENGDVVVLQVRHEQARDGHAAIVNQGKCSVHDCLNGMQVEKILRSPTVNIGSFCQCWSSDGSVLATAHDRRVTFYSATDGFRLLVTVQVRFSVTSMDIARLSSEGASDGDASVVAYLLAVGTAFGAHLYQVELSTSTSNQEREDGRHAAASRAIESLPPLASAYEEIPICFVKLAHDGTTIAIGSVDGRLYVRSLTNSATTTNLTGMFGSQVLAKVLAAPRVTSISFSPCSRRLAVATRKGNIYVLFQASSSSEWQVHAPCKELSSNPKPIAQPSSSAAPMQTLVCWWSSEVLVVASRAANYRLEMVDVKSGKLLHTLQIDTRPANSNELSSSAVTDDQLLTGVCCVKLTDGHAKLVCHDTSSNLCVLSWPLLEMEEHKSGPSLRM